MNGSIREAHTAELCNCKLGTGQSCCTNLWGSKATFQQHRIEFLNRTQETRTQSVFAMLKDSYYTEQDVTGQPVGGRRWHFSVNTDLGQRAVCKGVFLLAYPIGHATLARIQQRIKNGCTMAHDKRDDEHIFKDERKSLGIIGWYIGYAESMGDWMPDSNELVVPRRDRQDEHEEYELALGEDAAAYSFFCRIIGTAPELAHIVRVCLDAVHSGYPMFAAGASDQPPNSCQDGPGRARKGPDRRHSDFWLLTLTPLSL